MVLVDLEEPDERVAVLELLFVLVAPRRVVVEEPSVLTVRVVVRDEPLELTRLLVVVEAGVTRVEDAPELLVPLVREEELLELLEVPEVLDVLEELELPEPLVVLVLLDELELLVVLVLLDELELLVEPVLLELLELLELVAAVRLVEVVVVVVAATRCCRSRALVIAAVRLEPAEPLVCALRFSAATRLENDWSGWRVA